MRRRIVWIVAVVALLVASARPPWPWPSQVAITPGPVVVTTQWPLSVPTGPMVGTGSSSRVGRESAG